MRFRDEEPLAFQGRHSAGDGGSGKSEPLGQLPYPFPGVGRKFLEQAELERRHSLSARRTPLARQNYPCESLEGGECFGMGVLMLLGEGGRARPHCGTISRNGPGGEARPGRFRHGLQLEKT